MMTPTLFSVSYAGLWGQTRLDLHRLFRGRRHWAIPQSRLWGSGRISPSWTLTILCWTRWRKLPLNRGVEIATIAGYTDFTSGKNAAEVPFVEMQVAYVQSLSAMAIRLGAKNVRVFTGYSTDPDAYRSDWDRCVVAIRECAAVAETYGVTLGVQNHHDIGVAWESFAEFLDDVDHRNCRAMFDPWAPALHGDDLRACARELAPRMVQTTLADYVKLRRFCYSPGLVTYRPMPERVLAVPLGEGFLDLEGFFSGLKEGGFSGHVAYEMCSPLRGGGAERNMDAAARKSLEAIVDLAARP